MKKKVIVFSAPSGAGKSTILGEVLKRIPDLEFSISACNRKPRGEEIDGREYYFLSTEDFQKKISENEFLEWEEIYEGRFYGTLKKEFERIWDLGKTVISDLDVMGGMNIKNKFSENALTIFIKPPSLEILERRLTARGTDSKEDIARRIAKAEKEISFANHFDHIVVNDDLGRVVEETIGIVNKFLEKC